MVNISETSIKEKTLIYNLNKVKCEECDGTGFQQREDGIFVLCPVCDGDGWYETELPVSWYPEYPYYQWLTNDINFKQLITSVTGTSDR